MSMRPGRMPLHRYIQRLWRNVQAKLFPPVSTGHPRGDVPTLMRVCVVVPTFPILGGILTVLEGIEQVTQDRWRVEYLVQRLGSQRERYTIHAFGSRYMAPWHSPFDWLYIMAGVVKFAALMRRGAGYCLIMPQDGVFSAALAGLAGKMTGTRVVCVDHGEISLFTPRNNRVYREERVADINANKRSWAARFIARTLLALHWPSRLLAARVAARLVDHYLIPGVPGDSIEEGCNILGIPLDHVTRFGSMIDIDCHIMPDTAARVAMRAAKGIPADAVVVAIAARLSAEKSLDIALESIDCALGRLAADQRERVRVVIAGDGPLRAQLEQDVQERGLARTCLFWGELTPDEVKSLLGISDIFLYTSTRGACIPMAVLEAMASGCAVIATTEPLANAVLLAEGRGVTVPAGDVEQTTRALVRLLADAQLCQQMGLLARDYIRLYHNPALFRHVLLQAAGNPVGEWAYSSQNDAEAIGQPLGRQRE